MAQRVRKGDWLDQVRLAINPLLVKGLLGEQTLGVQTLSEMAEG